MMKRRTFLGGTAAAAALASCKDGGDTADLTEAGIDHVIVIMMENRSFDHFLGALAMEGMPVEGLTGDESNPDSSGVDHPVFHLDEACQLDPPHGWGDSHNQFNGGLNDGFVLEHEDRVGMTQGPWVMGYYTREDLPAHYALADDFCVPDQFFCSVMSSTWPNRFYGHTGSSKGIRHNDLPDDGNGIYDQKSIYQALAEVGLDWHYYYTDVPFIGLLHNHWDSERIDFIEDFFRDVEAGKLPEFTWIDPGFTWNDDHPPHHVGAGQMFLALAIEALARSPIWERCLIVITYDEHGGFFDHVPPPLVDDDYADTGFDQLGFRVPALVVGPWVKQGVVSEVFDNTSVLKYICDRFGIEPWTKRIADANSIGLCLDEDRMASNEPLSPPTIPAFSAPGMEELPEECLYRSERGGQPELEAWVDKNMPETARYDLADAKAFFDAKAREYGLL
jgi:phospholipase C